MTVKLKLWSFPKSRPLFKSAYKKKSYFSTKIYVVGTQKNLLNETVLLHRVASTPELATNFIDYKQMAGMTTVRKSCYKTVLSRRYALRWIYFYLNIFIFEIYTQQ